MFSSVLMLILGIGCLVFGLYLIIGFPQGSTFLLHQGLAVVFFLLGTYLIWDFALDNHTSRQDDPDEFRNERRAAFRKAKR